MVSGRLISILSLIGALAVGPSVAAQERVAPDWVSSVATKVVARGFDQRLDQAQDFCQVVGVSCPSGVLSYKYLSLDISDTDKSELWAVSQPEGYVVVIAYKNTDHLYYFLIGHDGALAHVADINLQTKAVGSVTDGSEDQLFRSQVAEWTKLTP